jgi:hypothetical protein
MAQECAGFGFVCEAHPAAHIEIRVGGCNAAAGPKDKQGVELFFSGALRAFQIIRPSISNDSCIQTVLSDTQCLLCHR